MTKKIIISTICVTFILFLWGGATQFLPWGVPSTQTINAQSSNTTELFQVPNLIELETGSLTTASFDERMANNITTYATDKTFSWIITKPIAYYNIGAYFTRELITQTIVALLLSLLLWHLRDRNLKERLGMVLIFGLVAVISINGPQFNWWGVPAIYAFGVSLNLIVGWLIASFISSKFIIKTI